MDGFDESIFKGPNGDLACFHIKPNKAEIKQVILCAHGGPGGDGRGNGNVFPNLGRSLLNSGIATVTFDFFGNGASEGTSTDCTISTQVSDLESIYRDTQSRYDAQIVVCGESLGATIVRASTLEDLSGEILLWPAFDLLDTDLRDYFSPEWKKNVSEQGLLEDGEFRLGAQYYKEILEWDYSLLYELDRCPAMIAHGRQDDEVPASQSLKAIGLSKVVTHLHLYPDGHHGLRDNKIRNNLLEHIKAFLRTIE